MYPPCPAVNGANELQDRHPLPFNISHDNRLVILAYGEGSEDIGVDVMKVELPKNETVSSFIRVLDDQVRASYLLIMSVTLYSYPKARADIYVRRLEKAFCPTSSSFGR